MQALSQLLKALQLEANVFHNGQYCGMWAIDTSGSQQMTFHVVTHGVCNLRVGNEWLSLNTGDAVLFPSDSEHRVSNVVATEIAVNTETSVSLTEHKEDGTGLVCGYFCHQNPVFDKLAQQLPRYLVIRKNSLTPASSVIDLLIEESKSSGQSTNLLLNRLSDCLLYLVLRDNVDTSRGLFSAVTHPKLGKALELMHNEVGGRASIDDMAKAAGMSRSAFTEQFKKMVGASPVEYQTQWRMTNAWRWLADEGITTLEAALRCGYESEASFSKAFKRVLGVGPGAARQQNRSRS